MLKGKSLYAKCREFGEETVIPLMEEQEDDDDPTAPVATRAASLGIALIVDIAESLHKISVKIG
jgi:hypothetical protein